MMKRMLAVILAAGFVVGTYATDARVAVMGRQKTPYFYRDEVTVFTNPADMSLYPNLIYGSFGWLSQDLESPSFTLKNTTPVDPHFGGMISYNFNDQENGPMLSIGAYVNRRDYVLDQLMKEDTSGTLPDPLGKFDVMLGYDFGNGLAIGFGFYTAYQREAIKDVVLKKTSIQKATVGLNYNIEQGLDFEASVNAGVTGAMWTVDSLTGALAVGNSPTNKRIDISNGDYFLRGDVRFFSAVPSINGSFVPQVSLEYMTMNGKDITDLAGGVGINMNIDRGFFWAGLQGVYTQVNTEAGNGANDQQSIGARLSFGIERNIVWDWFLIRVGGQKEFRHMTVGSDYSRWLENPSSTGFDDDLVGLGFGINIDNRLRVDFVASEDLPYTFTNLISGAQHHLFNRVSATYRF